MKRTLYAVLTVVALAAIVGCASDRENCRSCQSGCPYARAEASASAAGYPYYTNRGPRDFYTTQPYSSIGP